MANKTGKIIAAVAIVAISVLVLTPKVIGLGIRDLTTNNLIALLPPEASTQMAINETSFSSGWFASTATLSTDYVVFGTDIITVDFDFSIQHGPLLFTNSGPRLGVAYAEITPKIDETIPAFESASELPFPETLIELFVGFNQSLLIAISVDPINFSGTGEVFNFAGLNASFLARADKSADLSLSIGKLEFRETQNNIDFTIDGLELISKSTQIDDILAPTSATFSIPRIKSTAPIDLTISNITASSELRDSNNPNAIALLQHVATQDIVGDSPLKSFDWQLEIDEVQRRLISDYYDLLSQFQTQSAADPQAAALQINQISQELSLLIANNPLVVNNLVTATVYDGSHRAEMKLRWDGMPALNNIAMLNLKEALAAMNLSLDISLDFDAIMRSPAADQVKSAAEQGFILIENDRILVNATLSNSQLTLNGEDIPLNQFF